MIVDIYLRDKDDPKFNPNAIEISNSLEIFIQKLLMILNTQRGSVLGNPNFGIDLSTYIFDFEFDDALVKNEIINQISSYISEDEKRLYKVDVDIKRFRGEDRDVVLIDFIINDFNAFGVLVK